MKINKLSDNFTPLSEGIYFGIETEEETPTDLIVEILELSTGEVVATQLLRNVLSATVNIAPYMEHFVQRAPSSHRQTAFSEAPTAGYKIRIDGIESEEIIVSINRCKIDTTPSLITSFPKRRRIACGESDEVVIISGKGNKIYAEIESESGEMLNYEYLPTSEASILTISPDDFEREAKAFDMVIYCAGKVLGTLCYVVTQPLKSAVRLAWISESGAIERYTFPTSYKSTLSTEKRSIMTNEGLCTAHCRAKQIISLCSRFESCTTIEALAQIATSPRVWIEHNGHYQPIEVTSPEINYNIFGEPSHIHFNICLWQKEVAL